MKTRSVLVGLAVVAMFSVPAVGQVGGVCDSQGEDVNFQGKIWDAWFWCISADPNFDFNRIDMHVGKPDQPAKLDFANPPLAVCKVTGEKVTMDFKAHEKFFACANGDECFPGGPPCADGSPCLESNNHEVWSAEFPGNCEGSVDVYVQIDPNRPPGWQVIIKEVVFSHVGPPKPIPTVSEWGVAVMTLLLLVGGKVYFSRRRAMQA